jgi:transposase
MTVETYQSQTAKNRRVLYHTRNLLERLLSRIKRFRRVSTRYERLAESYLVFASLACLFGTFVIVNTA